MKTSSDIDIAVICPSKLLKRTKGSLESISDDTHSRFGNRLDVTIGTRSIVAMSRQGQRQARLWRTIAREGEPLKLDERV